MKFVSTKSIQAIGVLFVSALAITAPAFVYETALEFLADGDFDGDGRMDVVIVHKTSGKCRFGYQTSDGQFNWVQQRPSGVAGATGITVGKLLKPNCDALGDHLRGWQQARGHGCQFRRHRRATAGHPAE